jgi:hypothetical protein
MDEKSQRQKAAQGLTALAPHSSAPRMRTKLDSLASSPGCGASPEDIRLVHARLMMGCAIENVAKLGFTMQVARGNNADCAKIGLRTERIVYIPC